MAEGLSVSRVVNVTVNFAPQAIPSIRFDTLLIMGDSTVVDTGEAIREYNSILEVAGDFASTAPEFIAAELFFSQTPQPSTLFIGRWAATATHGRLTGGPLPNSEQLLSNWTTVTAGAFAVSLDGGTVVNVSGLNFSAVQNLNAVASAIQTALRTAGGAPATNATFTWDGSEFVLNSGTTGLTSSVSFLTTATPPGTDISAKLHMTSATAQRNVVGMGVETPLAALIRVDGRGWYAVTFAASVALTDPQHLSNSAYIEAATDKHLYAVTTNEAITLDPTNSTDLASQAALADYTRTVIQYSNQTPYAICSFLGRALTVNFEGSNTTITMKFKVEPGVIPELLTASQASTLANKRCNVYALYNNGASISQEGVMSGLAYFDEIHGLDWLANRIQNDVWNLLYQSPKVPQTNAGVHQLVNAADGGLSQASINGLVAPGIWNAPGFGTLQTGDLLANGWYTFANSVDTQSQADREARIAPLIQIAVKLAGAIHFADVLINVNR
jgi:hypothetical protein